LFLTKQLTLWNIVHAEKLTLAQLVKKFLLWNPNVHYSVHKSFPVVHIRSQVSPVHTLPSSFFILLLSSYLRLVFQVASSLRVFFGQNVICICDLGLAAWPVHLILLTFITLVTSDEVQVRSYEICGGQSGTGAGFLRVLRFPLPILIPSTAPHSSSSVVGTIRQLVATYQVDSVWPHPKKQKKKSDEHELWSFLLCNCLWRLPAMEVVKCFLPIETLFSYFNRGIIVSNSSALSCNRMNLRCTDPRTQGILSPVAKSHCFRINSMSEHARLPNPWEEISCLMQ
jgi:hypothetical protein